MKRKRTIEDCGDLFFCKQLNGHDWTIVGKATAEECREKLRELGEVWLRRPIFKAPDFKGALARIANLNADNDALREKNERLFNQVAELQRHANQQLNRIRKLTWTSTDWANYESTFGPQDCGPE